MWTKEDFKQINAYLNHLPPLKAKELQAINSLDVHADIKQFLQQHRLKLYDKSLILVPWILNDPELEIELQIVKAGVPAIVNSKGKHLTVLYVYSKQNGKIPQQFLLYDSYMVVNVNARKHQGKTFKSNIAQDGCQIVVEVPRDASYEEMEELDFVPINAQGQVEMGPTMAMPTQDSTHDEMHKIEEMVADLLNLFKPNRKRKTAKTKSKTKVKTKAKAKPKTKAKPKSKAVAKKKRTKK